MELNSITDIGVKRKDNQDNYWSARLDVNGEEIGVICLCDGMGGLDKGGFASKVVVEAVRNFLVSDLDIDGLKKVIKDAHEHLFNISKLENISLGTTCTVLIARKGIYEVLHIGDSRCYHYSSKGVSIITKDHTVIEKYRSMGKELPPHLQKKYKNTLTRCIGVSSKMDLDYYTGKYSEGDLFLVCSDGFWHFLKESDFKDIGNLNKLVKSFIQSGETDNITVVTFQV